jgi:hypothetical protein
MKEYFSFNVSIALAAIIAIIAIIITIGPPGA